MSPYIMQENARILQKRILIQLRVKCYDVWNLVLNSSVPPKIRQKIWNVNNCQISMEGMVYEWSLYYIFLFSVNLKIFKMKILG